MSVLCNASRRDHREYESLGPFRALQCYQLRSTVLAPVFRVTSAAMNTATLSPYPGKLPARVKVTEVISGRYSTEVEQAVVKDSQWFVADLNRPLNWDDRKAGTDIVKLDDGSEIKLNSSGMQSVPKPGWVLLLTSGDEVSGFKWTLYGITS